eukprot:TRINITY_DN112082_c0_g1_i1.p1 TRINITY_DN112082_c0_g1~~TRINITY_DN112082_c0_g1_i1.p1  ORF type:complete len:264 (-),score=96.42 TRINITY_DN112082_c0_g1_i1:131-853(-)
MAPAVATRKRSSRLVLGCAALCAAAACLSASRGFVAGLFGSRGLTGGAARANSAVKMQANMVQVPGDLKKGQRLLVEGNPLIVVDYVSKKVGKGVAITKAKMQNMLTGANIDKSLQSGAKYEEIETVWSQGTYSYFDADDDCYVLLDTETYEEMRIKKEVVGEIGIWIKEGANVDVEVWEQQIVSVQSKGDIIEEVVEVKKKGTVELSNGVTKTGPDYLKVGDKVQINAKTYEIMKRISE